MARKDHSYIAHLYFLFLSGHYGYMSTGRSMVLIR